MITDDDLDQEGTGSWVARPIRLTNAGLKALKSARSPRQCSRKVPGRPRRLWVAIGPFIGWIDDWMAGSSWPLTSTGSIVPRGLPRSHAMLSKSPNTWHVAHAWSPCPDVKPP